MRLSGLRGIPIRLHPSWFVIFGLLTWSLATGYLAERLPGESAAVHWFLGGLTSLLFFGSVLTHELGHALIALRNGIPVRRITLFFFGGVAQIEHEPGDPGVEFRVTLAGPLTSLGLSFVFTVLSVFNEGTAYAAAPAAWLARINFMLAAFNMIPAFPLDGGRVLRALLWRLTGDLTRATRVAATTGQVVAFGLIALGLLTFAGGAPFDGMWLGFIGWFVYNAAAGSKRWSNLQLSLRGVPVSQVMSQECVDVSSLLPLSKLVEERVLSGGRRCFLVTDNGDLRGLLTLRDIRAIPRNNWRHVTTGQAMVPIERVTGVAPSTELAEVLHMMETAQVAQVPVTEEGQIIGLLSRDEVLGYLQMRNELGV